jgi:hypothetical protein
LAGGGDEIKRRSAMSGLAEAFDPAVDVRFGNAPFNLVTFEDAIDEVGAAAARDRKIVLCEAAPPILKVAAHVFPLSFDVCPFHPVYSTAKPFWLRGENGIVHAAFRENQDTV